MPEELDPADGMPSRGALAMETLVYQMRELSDIFYSAQWIDGLEFLVWDMAHKKPHRLADTDVSDKVAKFFRDLAILADGWWVWPETAGRKGDREIFVSLEEWKDCLKKRDSPRK